MTCDFSSGQKRYPEKKRGRYQQDVY